MAGLSKELKYMKIFKDLQINITTYKLRAGMQLLGVRELMAHYNASYSTVMKALRELESAGLVESVQGKGIFVKKRNGANDIVRNNLIGLIVTDMNIPFFNRIIHVIEGELTSRGYDVIIRNTDFNSVVEKDIISNFIERGVQGVIMVPTFDELDTSYLAQVDRDDIDIIYIVRRKHGYNCSFVVPDDYDGGKQAIEFLLEHGHRDIAYISGLPIKENDQRFKAFQDTFMHHGLTVNDDWIIYGEKFEFESGYDSMLRILSQKKKPTALMCYTDSIAAGAMKACRDSGYSIPEDFSVIGYNNEDITDFIEPNITTVENPIADICRLAVGSLIEKVENPNQRNTVNQTVLPVRVVKKKSVRDL
ncbi:GntR family transcriptional regulator [Marispirochaeta aestuarii]|uniref:GntR family transcriptional regulator n=1 Tax=Marispirochaeta aestuarii TaxID=1963862 RepID=UPI0029C66E9F|nr:GntR family transcriptional regulator [Marispirochaeta aestuarii]